ncbi:DUF1499 domain-containing protein [Pseudosulfitobacter koreensis]|uniref:DUF1499 domain-containing protein n=1 Tax=Pseudosulfitobacter koreensis TaxID=2968472 RepID=A0ABT1Z0S1_9RHOB|nr:DUF1499 domain-containing protein [Pseudosulfitobacter koreense]MCR8826737.1 DUF1499 domain-containing protein [Pseudosulfitobacter koreense]
MFIWILVFLGVTAIAAVAYVRLAPSDTARWNQPVTATEDKDFGNGAVRVLPANDGLMARLDTAMRDLPRTEVLAGSVDAGRITYMTRTANVGFPDYTTIEQADGQVRMLARSRFGSSDMGVNAKRLKGLLATVQR